MAYISKAAMITSYARGLVIVSLKAQYSDGAFLFNVDGTFIMQGKNRVSTECSGWGHCASKYGIGTITLELHAHGAVCLYAASHSHISRVGLALCDKSK